MPTAVPSSGLHVKQWKPDWIPYHWWEIEACERDSSVGGALVQAARPVILKGSPIVPVSNWEHDEALRAKLSRTQVLIKHSSKHNVAYFRNDRNAGRHAWNPEDYIVEEKVHAHEFLDLAEKNEEQRRSSLEEGGEESEDSIYCQESFLGHPELQSEFDNWDWRWVLDQCKRMGWGAPKTNVLFMGTAGATTPAHFDEQHNFLNQVRGYKLVVLFPQEDYPKMYPFPVTHPCDRCSMIDIKHPDLQRFPRFAEASGYYTVLGPGDMLYIPYGWWHYCRTLTNLAASITFWAEVSSPGANFVVPERFGSDDLTRARRNIEKMLAQDVGPPNLENEVLRILQQLELRNLSDMRIVSLRKLLEVLKMPDSEHVRFLKDTFQGRFGFDQNKYV